MKRGKKNFTISNRWLYTFILLGILGIVAVGVYAAYPASGAGHNSNEIDFSTGQFANVGKIRDADGGWIRTYGNTGWYSETYGGGWYMTDNTWIRAYGDKSIYTPSTIQATTLYASGTLMTSKISFNPSAGRMVEGQTCSTLYELAKCEVIKSTTRYTVCVCSGPTTSGTFIWRSIDNI
jgi:hypothetical protein